MIRTAYPIFLGDKIENEMGWVCSMYGEEERCILDFGGEA